MSNIGRAPHSRACPLLIMSPFYIICLLVRCRGLFYYLLLVYIPHRHDMKLISVFRIQHIISTLDLDGLCLLLLASYTSFLLPCTSLATAIEINAIVLQCQKRAAHMITRVLSFLMMMFSPHGGFFLYVLLKRHSKLLLATNSIIPDRSTFVG